MNLLALSSTHPSAAFVMINTCPLFFDKVSNLHAYLSISSILLDIAAGIGYPIGC